MIVKLFFVPLSPIAIASDEVVDLAKRCHYSGEFRRADGTGGFSFLVERDARRFQSELAEMFPTSIKNILRSVKL